MHKRTAARWTPMALLAIGVLCSALPEPVQAQEPVKAPSDPETIKKVLGLLKAASAHYDAKAYDKALPLYKEAYALYPDPAMLYRMGETAEAMGSLREAVGYYDKVAAALPDDPKVKTLVKRLPSLKSKVPPLITITSTPSGANVYKDSVTGDPIGSTPYEGEAQVGDVTYVLRMDGYETARRVVTHEPAGQQELAVTLQSSQVNEPSAGIEEPSPSGGSLRTIGYVTAGTGVALLATGGIFSLLQSSKTDEVNSFDKRGTQSPAQGRAQLQELKDQAESYHSTSLIFYVVGSLVTVAGAGVVAYDMMQSGQEPAAAQTGLRWGFELAPQGASVGISGQF